ncbi:MAG: sulfate adenylyltransferase [Myxococcales bacterium]|nr:sulfate adenylyltransferase [Myxococcales bacterium]
MDLLRFSTAGSVDDGKSTLIGRLLYDTKTIFEDQLAAVQKATLKRGQQGIDLALVTDGLRAEREQGITIDVAYRYFASPRRKFIISDTPGHIQYTRNMVTGASTAHLAVILVDARNGVVEQTCRHAFISSLLGIQNLVVAVNKMDLVDWSEDAFEKVVKDFEDFASRLDIAQIQYIPISALLGDNVVERSSRMNWYEGPALLYHLETVHVAGDNPVDARFPVQAVIRPQQGPFADFRGYAGRVAGGVFRVGDEVVALPSGFTTRVSGLHLMGKDLEEAFAPMSVTMTLADDIDIGRGHILCKPQNQPETTQDLDAMVCWFSSSLAMRGGQRLLLRQTSREVQVVVREVLYKVDVNTLHRVEGETDMGLNDVGRVKLRTSEPLFVDPYRRNRTTGSFILVDPKSFDTVGAGTLRG